MNEQRGFASLSPERRKEIAAMGGRSVPKYKRTFRKNRALARSAGAKGGANVPAEKRAFCDRAKARLAGCKGGKKATANKRSFRRIRGLAKRAGTLGLAARAANKL
jgi:general stress protein YciG